MKTSWPQILALTINLTNNMLIKITNVINKSNDWKVISYETPEGGVTENASVNRFDKKGTPFPDFDGIVVGRTIDANPWRNPTSGKWSVFPPKPQNDTGYVSDSFRASTSQNYANKGTGMKAAQERKAEMIEKAQDRKNESIAYFNAVNSAIALLSSHKALISPSNPIASVASDNEIHLFITKWRDWFLDEWKKYEAKDVTDKTIPF